MCAKSDNFLNCSDQSMHRVLQDRYIVFDVMYSVCDQTDTHMEVVISDMGVVLSLHRLFDVKYS